ncbi:MAG: hypothetical protein JWN86_1093 [Planctomycetota bacterium]|nr:hypothetical protein [Planctomycetota bacterium]
MTNRMNQRRPRSRTVLVTGASSGIGAGIARRLMSEGASHRLVLTARRVESLESLANDARQQGCDVLVLPDDLADPDAPERIISAAVARFGGIDVLINNAGLGLPDPFSRANPLELARQIQVNFTAPLILTRLALPYLVKSKGTIINIGSSITCVANPIFGAYGATKAALAYWNDALRRELRPHGVSVCLAEPGPVVTEFFQAVASRFPGRGSQGGGFSAEDLASAETFRQFAAIDPPPAWTSATVDDVACRIVRLLEHPRRRISVLRRVVWPFRALGLLIRAVPLLGDIAIGRMVTRMEALPADPNSNAGGVADVRAGR